MRELRSNDTIGIFNMHGRDGHQSPLETARSTGTPLSRSDSASTLNTTVFGSVVGMEQSLDTDEPDVMIEINQSAITPCAPAVDPWAAHTSAVGPDIPSPRSSSSNGSLRTASSTSTELESTDRTPLQTPQPALRLLRHVSEVPWIPNIPAEELGPGTNKLIAKIWWDVGEELRACYCGICERGRVGRRA